MKIDVKHVAKLANLKISPDEETKFENQLSDILTYVEKLNEVKTEGIEETAQVESFKQWSGECGGGGDTLWRRRMSEADGTRYERESNTEDTPVQEGHHTHHMPLST